MYTGKAEKGTINRFVVHLPTKHKLKLNPLYNGERTKLCVDCRIGKLVFVSFSSICFVPRFMIHESDTKWQQIDLNRMD